MTHKLSKMAAAKIFSPLFIILVQLALVNVTFLMITPKHYILQKISVTRKYNLNRHIVE